MHLPGTTRGSRPVERVNGGWIWVIGVKRDLKGRMDPTDRFSEAVSRQKKMQKRKVLAKLEISDNIRSSIIFFIF
jgi:hypothetical protein